ncbi:MAG: 16S rRNA (uracil(1498)-N(3))-methyltransferase [Coriobacteriia bacterium]|nr:16S rRNA (uracil(1498)-N(3))-methyltransferase [Coriobacteriia bacterium]
MSLPRFFLTSQVLAEQTADCFALQLDPDDVKHAGVLRLCAGEHLAVVDAVQDYFECEVVSFEAGEMLVRIAGHESPAPRPRITLLQGLAKGEKMELVIRHATEVGVGLFVPVACQRSVMRVDPLKAGKKTQRWRAIAKSAAMQSGQPAVPGVNAPLPVRRACELIRDFDAVLVAWEEAPRTCTIQQALQDALGQASPEQVATARIAVVVGPEGGLDEAEVDLLLASNPAARLVTLGPTILRTETAGIVAPALVRYQLGLMSGRP